MIDEPLDPLDFANKLSGESEKSRWANSSTTTARRVRIVLLGLAGVGLAVIAGVVLVPRLINPPQEPATPLATPPSTLGTTTAPTDHGSSPSLAPAAGPAPVVGLDPSVVATPYQAVTLASGQILFGRLDRSGDAWPLLTDVYSIRQGVNAATKEVTSTLIRRANEPHAPDRMAINPAQILLIEPVRAGSNVARLIDELKKARPAATTTTPGPGAISK